MFWNCPPVLWCENCTPFRRVHTFVGHMTCALHVEGRKVALNAGETTTVISASVGVILNGVCMSLT